MNVPSKTCPACGADVNAEASAMPGACPACGRDLRLEEIVAKLGRAPGESPTHQTPMNLVECAAASIGLALLLSIVLGLATGTEPGLAFVLASGVAGPNFFAGFYIAGRWKHTAAAQLLLGFFLGIGFACASLAMLFAGCAALGIR